MAVINQTSTTSTVNLSANSVFLLAEDQSIITTSLTGIDAGSSADDNIQMFIYGKVLALGDSTNASIVSTIDIGGDDVELFLGEKAEILATGDEGPGAQGTRGIDIGLASGVTVTNHGNITSHEYGISVVISDDIHISNFGIISATGSSGAGLRLSSSDNSNVKNFGVISGASGVTSTGDGSTFVNRGTIIGLNSSGFSLSGQGGTLTNYGFISSHGSGVSGGSAEQIVRNFGTIDGNVSLSAGDDVVTNRGVIEGSVSLSSDNDTYDGRGGIVTGNVSGGSGNDIFIVDNADTVLFESAGQGTDLVRSTGDFTLGDNFENLTLLGNGNLRGTGNSENNVLTGNAAGNRLNGQDGDDTLHGRGGDDELRGQDGNDTQNGGRGFDLLRGGLGDDNLNGDQGADIVLGGHGDDTLNGGNGDDILEGGRGKDILSGNAGDDRLTGGGENDVFVFADGFGKDVITDFNAKAVKEDVSLVGVTSIVDWADLRDNHMNQKGADVLINAGGGNTILLKGVDLADLQAGDFLF